MKKIYIILAVTLIFLFSGNALKAQVIEASLDASTSTNSVTGDNNIDGNNMVSNVIGSDTDLDNTNITFTSIDDNDDITTNSPTGDGVIVNFTPPEAIDSNSNSLYVTCSSSSGSFFPIGDTLVTCSATDSNGTTVSSSFMVTVTQD